MGKLTKRNALLLIFVFCLVEWSLIWSVVVYAADDDKTKPESHPGGEVTVVDIKKIKELDLTDKQRKFIESLIEKPKHKSE